MKGWVYVMSNKSMPGLVKVGFSTKDPELRAKEMGHTGAPNSYEIDYELLTENPKLVESTAHRNLSACNEGKEWFRCDCETAVIAIQDAANGKIIHENYIAVERERILQKKRKAERELIEAEKQKKRREEEARAAEKQKLLEAEQEKKRKVEAYKLEVKETANSILNWVVGWMFLTCVLTFSLYVIAEMPDSGFVNDSENKLVGPLFIGGFISALVLWAISLWKNR